LRILVLNYEFPPLGGGAGRASFYITRELARAGWDVDVVTSRWDPYQPQVPDGVRVLSVPTNRRGVHECGLRAAAQYVARAFPLACRLVQENRYALSHSFFSLPTGLVSLRLKRRYGLPYVVSLRGSDVPGYDPSAGQMLHRLTAPLTRRVWREAAAVVANSGGLRELAQRFYDLPMGVIHNGIDPDLFHPVPPADPAREADLQILCVSRLLERKGIHHLIEALSRARDLDLRLDIAGEGNYEAHLKSLTDALGLADRVRFLGYVPNNDLPTLYSRYDLFALPSLTESFGIVFAEAMACGLPVLATTVGGIPEVVRNGVDGILVPPGDVDALASSLRDLARDRGRLREMGRAGLERITTQFTWTAVARAYEEVYRTALSSAQSLPRA
jgi:glycosyltransferase involved in cell wall biosynthesis